MGVWKRIKSMNRILFSLWIIRENGKFDNNIVLKMKRMQNELIEEQDQHLDEIN